MRKNIALFFRPQCISFPGVDTIIFFLSPVMGAICSGRCPAFYERHKIVVQDAEKRSPNINIEQKFFRLQISVTFMWLKSQKVK